MCEPQLSKRGIQPQINSKYGYSKFQKCILDLLQYCYGKKRLKEISKIIKVNISFVIKFFNILKKKKLVR